MPWFVERTKAAALPCSLSLSLSLSYRAFVSLPFDRPGLYARARRLLGEGSRRLWAAQCMSADAT